MTADPKPPPPPAPGSLPGSPASGWLPVAALAALLLGLGLATLLRPDLAGSTSLELRDPARWPGSPENLRAIRNWPRLFDAYVNDHVPGRSRLIHGANTVLWRFGISGSPEVLPGLDGWLFLRRSQNLVDRSRGLLVPSASQLEAWITGTRDLFGAVRQAGAVPWLVVVPEKNTAVAGKLPPWARPREGSATDAILAALRRGGLTNVLDLRPTFLSADVPEGDLFWRSDTHWNARGALLAAGELEKAWRAAGTPGTLRLPAPADLVPQRRSGDLARMLGLPELFREEGPILDPAWCRAVPAPGMTLDYPSWLRRGYRASCPAPAAGRILVYGDSFFHSSLYEIVQESFAEMVFYNHQSLTIPRWSLTRDHPDVVLFALVERLLPIDGPKLVD